MGPVALGVMSLILPATGQETIYSADSLMAKFERGSKVSLKGTQITFRGTVAESDDMKVTFKSSHSGRVICRLVASNENQGKPALVGSETTVTGKIRGRGLLGNVTLDDCSLALIADSQGSANPSQPADPPEEVASTPVGAPPEEATEVASLPTQPDEIKNDYAPIQSTPPPKPAIRKHREKTAPPSGLEQQNQTANGGGSDSPRAVPYRLYALLILGGAVGYSILSKLLISIAGAMRSASHGSGANTEEVRKAALEELLLKDSKKK
jgi:hypothetical protein